MMLCDGSFSDLEHERMKRRAETILVVEDEVAIAELIEYNLLKAGYHVLLSTSGEAALALAKSELPALILLDIMLPGLDGLEVCRRLNGNLNF